MYIMPQAVPHQDRTSKLSSVDKDEADKQDAEDLGFGLIEVVENVFAYRQSFALKEGDNIIGRQNPGDNITIPIETTDRSIPQALCNNSYKGSFNR